MKKRTEHIDIFFKKSLFDYEEAPPWNAWNGIAHELDTMDKNRETDDYFKQNLYGIEHEAPSGTWDSIAKSLDLQDKKRNFRIIYKVAAAVVFLLALGSGYLYFSNPSVESIQTASEDIIDGNNNSKPNIAVGDIEEQIAMDVPTPSQTATTKTENLHGHLPESHATNEINGIAASNKKLENKNTNPSDPPNPTESNADNGFVASNKKQENRNTNPSDPPNPTESNADNGFVFPGRETKDADEILAAIEPKGGLIKTSYDLSLYYSDDYMEAMLYGDLLASESVEEDNNDLAWAVGGQFSPLYTGSNVSNRKESSFLNSTNLNDDNMLAYSGGVNVNIQTNNRLTIQSGIYYSTTGLKINGIGVHDNMQFANTSKGNYLSNQAAINTSYGTVVTDPNNTFYVDYSENSPSVNWNDETALDWTGKNDVGAESVDMVDSYNRFSEDYNSRVQNVPENYSEGAFQQTYDMSTGLLNPSTNLNHSFEFVEIPIILKYKLLQEKLNVQVMGGVSANMLVNNDLFYFTYEGNKNYIPQQKEFRKFGYASILGFGIEYPFATNFMVNIEPAFKYQLNSINLNDFYKSHPYSFAFYSGISYKF